MQWDLGWQGIGVLIGMSLGFAFVAQLIGGKVTRWMGPVAGLTFFVAGLFTSEVWFGWATQEELQPNIDGLSLDEVLLIGLLAGTTAIVVTWRLVRHRAKVAAGKARQTLVGHR